MSEIACKVRLYLTSCVKIVSNPETYEQGRAGHIQYPRYNVVHSIPKRPRIPGFNITNSIYHIVENYNSDVAKLYITEI